MGKPLIYPREILITFPFIFANVERVTYVEGWVSKDKISTLIW
jgi:hypothetical protein